MSGERRRDVAARAELARVLEEAERLPEAITEHLALLRLEPLRVDSLRALRRLFERSGQRRRALRAAAALAALGLTDAADVRAVREARAALDAGGDRARHRGASSTPTSATPTSATRRPRCWRRWSRCCRASTAWRSRTGG